MDHNSEEFYQLCQRIVLLLSNKAIQEGKIQDKMNKILLGNSLFWIKTKKTKDGYRYNPELCFDETPKLWNLKKIKTDLDEQERILLINSGVFIHSDY